MPVCLALWGQGQEDPRGLLAWQCTWTGKLCETLSLKIRWRAIWEDSWRQPVASMCTCTWSFALSLCLSLSPLPPPPHTILLTGWWDCAMYRCTEPELGGTRQLYVWKQQQLSFLHFARHWEHYSFYYIFNVKKITEFLGFDSFRGNSQKLTMAAVKAWLDGDACLSPSVIRSAFFFYWTQSTRFVIYDGRYTLNSTLTSSQVFFFWK